jgi:type IV pilus assembly protein PilM
LAKRIITLDIDGETIRLLEARGRRVDRWASAPLEPGLVDNGSIPAPEALGARVRALMQSSGIKGRTVIVSLSGHYSVSRVLTVSGTSRRSRWEDIRNAVMQAMPTGEITPAWQTLDDGKGEHQVLAVGVPRDLLAAEVQALREAHLTPGAMELKGVALARAVNRERAIIINGEPSSLDMVVVVGGIPQIMRTSARADNLPVEDSAERLITTLEMTVGFYNSSHPDSPLGEDTPLFLVGQLAEDPALAERVQAGVPFPIEAFAPPLELPAHLPLARYAVNLGLALRQIPVPKDSKEGMGRLDIDLLRGVRPHWRQRARGALPYGAILVALILILLLYSAASNAIGRTAELRAELLAVQAQVELRRTELNRVAGLKERIGEYESIIAGRGYLTDRLRLLEKSAPEGVELRSFSLSRTAIAVEGTAETYALALAYTEALRGTGEFKRVELPRAGSEGGGFTVSAVPKKPAKPQAGAAKPPARK